MLAAVMGSAAGLRRAGRRPKAALRGLWRIRRRGDTPFGHDKRRYRAWWNSPAAGSSAAQTVSGSRARYAPTRPTISPTILR